ncbi:MAG: acyltransferase [Clostridia bacterium]|nr:acyltransferase [Clostridia bacterium]
MKKKHELTLVSLLYMLLVIFIHAASECVTGFRTDSFPFAVMCSAHRLSSYVVQGFLFLSGVKLFLPRRDAAFSYPKFYLSRVKRVVLPYLFVFALFCVYFVAEGRLALDLPYFLRECLTGGLVGHFYYVAIMCQFYLLIPIWRFAADRCSPALTVFVSLMTMLICRVHLPEVVRLLTGYELTLNSRLFTTFLFYFVCGIFCGRNYDRFAEFLCVRRREITVLCAVTGIVDCLLIWVIRNGVYYPAWADDFHVLYCTAAILCSLSYAKAFAERYPSFAERPFIRRLANASYNVYLIHPLFLFVADDYLERTGITSLTGRFVLRAAAVYAVSIGVCMLWEMIRTQIREIRVFRSH